MTALGAALHHDRTLADDTRALEAFLDRIIPDPRGVAQFVVPFAARRARPPTAYRRDKLMARVRARELSSFLLDPAAKTPDEENLFISVGLQTDTRNYGSCISLALGHAALARLGSQLVLDAVIELADALTPRGGVVFTAETATFAHCLATGTGVGSLTAEQARRTSQVNYVLHWLRDKARGPEWGTFLSPEHVQRLGGPDRVRTSAGCELVRELRNGGMYLQLTVAVPTFDDADHAARLAALASVLASVLLDPSTLP